MMQFMILIPTINDVKDFTSAMNKCPADATVRSGRFVVDAKSIMGLFSLDLSQPVTLEIHSDDDELQALKEIERFIVKD